MIIIAIESITACNWVKSVTIHCTYYNSQGYKILNTRISRSFSLNWVTEKYPRLRDEDEDEDEDGGGGGVEEG